MPPSLERDLAAAIARQPDMEVVGKIGCRGIALLLEARRVAPGAVVLGSEDGELPSEISQIIGEFPDIGVVAVVDGNPPDACLAIRRAVFSGSSRENELLNVIRTVVGTELNSAAP